MSIYFWAFLICLGWAIWKHFQHRSVKKTFEWWTARHHKELNTENQKLRHAREYIGKLSDNDIFKIRLLIQKEMIIYDRDGKNVTMNKTEQISQLIKKYFGYPTSKEVYEEKQESGSDGQV